MHRIRPAKALRGLQDDTMAVMLLERAALGTRATSEGEGIKNEHTTSDFHSALAKAWRCVGGCCAIC